MGAIAIAGSGFLYTVGAGNVLNFYVATTGNDSNSGTSPGQAWLTIQHAFNFISVNVNFESGSVVINVGSGTFDGASITGSSTGIGGTCQLLGNGSANTTIQKATTSNVCLSASMPIGYIFAVNGVTFNVANFGAAISITATGVQLDLGDAVFGATGDIVVNYLGFSGFLSVTAQSRVKELGSTGVGQGVINFNSHSSQSISLQAGAVYTLAWTWSINGPGSNSPRFIDAIGQGYVDTFIAQVPNYAVSGGAITGTRFFVGGGGDIGSGGIDFNFLGPNYFPGTVAGIGDRISGYDGYIIPTAPNTQTSNYTVTQNDIDARVEMNLAGANTVTFPADSGTFFIPPGGAVTVTQIGAGNTTIVAGAGVTINNVGALAGQWASVKVYKTNTASTWTQTQT